MNKMLMTRIRTSLRSGFRLTVAVLALPLTLSACDWDGDGGGGAVPATIGGSVSGLLTGKGVVLQDNGGNNTSVSANGAFTFTTQVAGGSSYVVTVLTQPTGQTCSVTNGNGTAAAANVSNVTVRCSANTYSIGVTVSGLSATTSLVLQDNGADNLTVSAEGVVTFSTPVAYGSTYAVAVLTQPTGQTCTVANGSGTMAAANVSNVTVRCSINTYRIGATVSGLLANRSLVLQDNSGDDLSVSTNGIAYFNTSLAYGSTYSVTVLTQPADQTCSVTTGWGVVGAADVTVVVACIAKHFVYVANGRANSISAYAVNATTGALTAVASSPFAAGTGPGSVAIDPSGRFAYVANFSSGTVSAYAIDAASGALTAITGSPFAAILQPQSVRVAPSGKFAYVTSFPTNSVLVYAIDATTGALVAVAGSPFAAGTGPTSLTLHPSGRFAYVAAQSANSVSAYSVDANTGALTPIAGSSFSTPVPQCVTFDPSGKFAYIANWSANTVSAYSFDATTGALTAVPGSPFTTAPDAISVAIDPSGKFVYVANSSVSTVSAYTLDATTGALTAVAGSPFAIAGTNAVPYSVATDPSGKFVYTANAFGGSVSAFTIDATTGALTAIGDTVIGAASFPEWIAIK